MKAQKSTQYQYLPGMNKSYIYITPTWFQYQFGMFKSGYLSNTGLNLPYHLRGGLCMVTKLAFHPIKQVTKSERESTMIGHKKKLNLLSLHGIVK
jgi:hypothetical protein